MIQPETIVGRKEYFRKRREVKNSAWITDDNGVVHIPLRDGYEALIDAADRELAAYFNWNLHMPPQKNPNKKPKPYAEATVLEEFRADLGDSISLHRLLTGVPKSVEIDHENGNGLDCRQHNMRIATRSQNASNRHYPHRKSPYRGVVRAKKKWAAQLEQNGKNKHLGVRDTPEEAALLYNEAALKAFGEFAILNKIEAQV